MSDDVHHIDGDASPGAILERHADEIRNSRGCILLYMTADGAAEVRVSSIWTQDAAFLKVTLDRWMMYRLEQDAGGEVYD